MWYAHRDPRFARSCIVCTNVAESGITIPNVGIVISSGVQRRVSTDCAHGSDSECLTNAVKSSVTPATWPFRSYRLRNPHHHDEQRTIFVSSKVR